MKRNEPNTEFLRVLFTGRSGSTKTRTAYTAALDERLQPVLGIDAKGQTRSIRAYRPAPDILTVESTADVTRVYNWLKRGQNPADPIARSFELNPPYKTLVVDGWSQIQQWIVRSASGNEQKAAGEQMMLTAIQDYGVIFAQTMNIVELFYSLPIHIIGTVLEQERQEGESGPTNYRHQLVGQSRDQLSSYPEIVGRLVHIERVSSSVKDHKAVRELITPETSSICFFKPSIRHEAKDQTGALGDLMVDPTMTKILDLLEADDG
jgi:hypothetical protein